MTLHDPRALRDAFGAFMTGVTIVTSFDAAGRPLGFTANSFASVSLNPPLLLVSIACSSQNHDVFTAAPGFAVNILAETQKELSATFARPVPERFAGVDWQTGPAGSPVLAGVSAWFDCHCERKMTAGDHTILIGSIGAFKNDGAPGLGYYRGSYITPVQTASQLAAGSDIVVSAILQRDGMVLLIDEGNGVLGLPTARVGREGMCAALERTIAATGMQASPGLVYSIYEDSLQGCQHIVFLCPMAAGMARKGTFVALRRDILAAIGDDAQQKMLERLLEESKQGNYGLYFGDRDQGLVHALGAGGKP